MKDAVMTDCWYDCEDRWWHACADQERPMETVVRGLARWLRDEGQRNYL